MRRLLLALLIEGAACTVTPEVLPAYGGRSLDEVIDELGAPWREAEFVVTDTFRLYEYQGGLSRHLDPGDATMLIRELTWEQPGDRLLIVWFKQDDGRWIGLEGLRWDTTAIQL